MQKYNSIDLETSHTTPEELYNLINILLKNGYSMIVRQEISDYIIVEFNGSPEFGYPQPEWLTEDEKFSIVSEEEVN